MGKPVDKIKMFEPFIKLRNQNLCPFCGERPTEFVNEISWREFKISGLCQECQNKEFGIDDDFD